MRFEVLSTLLIMKCRISRPLILVVNEFDHINFKNQKGIDLITCTGHCPPDNWPPLAFPLIITETSQWAQCTQIAGVSIVCSNICSGPDQWKHQSSASLAFVSGIHRGLVNSHTKGQWREKYFYLMTSSWLPVFEQHRYKSTAALHNRKDCWL